MRWTAKKQIAAMAAVSRAVKNRNPEVVSIQDHGKSKLADDEGPVELPNHEKTPECKRPAPCEIYPPAPSTKRQKSERRVTFVDEAEGYEAASLSIELGDSNPDAPPEQVRKVLSDVDSPSPVVTVLDTSNTTPKRLYDHYAKNSEHWKHTYDVFEECKFKPKDYWRAIKHISKATYYREVKSRDRLERWKKFKSMVEKLSRLNMHMELDTDFPSSSPFPWLEKKAHQFLCTPVLEAMKFYIWSKFGWQYTRLQHLIQEFDDAKKMEKKLKFDWHVLRDAEFQDKEEMEYFGDDDFGDDDVDVVDLTGC